MDKVFARKKCYKKKVLFFLQGTSDILHVNGIDGAWSNFQL